MAHLVVSNTKRKGYTYTHHTLNKHNLPILKRSNEQGFTINASTESLSDADHAVSLGLPAVVVVPNDQPVPRKTPDGTRVLLCPAQSGNATCSTCKLCSVADRNVIIAFQAHGNQAKKVNAIVSAS